MCNSAINLNTEYLGFGSGGKSRIFLGKSAFASCNQLKITIGHEFIHATHNFMYSKNISSNPNKTFYCKGYLMTEISARNWKASMGVKNGYNHSFDLENCSWKAYPSYFKWLKSAKF